MSVHGESTSVRMRFKNRKRLLSSLNVIGYGFDELHDSWQFPSIEIRNDSTVDFEFSGIDEPRLIPLDDVAESLKLKGLSADSKLTFREQLEQSNFDLDELVQDGFFDELQDSEPSIIEDIIFPNLDFSQLGNEDDPLFRVNIYASFKERFGHFQSELLGYFLKKHADPKFTLRIKQLISSDIFTPDNFETTDGYAEWYDDYLSVQRLSLSVGIDFFEKNNIGRIEYSASVELDDDNVFIHFEQTADGELLTHINKKFSDVVCSERNQTQILPEEMPSDTVEAAQRIKQLLSDKNKLAAVRYLTNWLNIDVELGAYDRAILSMTFEGFYSAEEIHKFTNAAELGDDLDAQVMFDLANEIPKKLLHQIHRMILIECAFSDCIQRESDVPNDQGAFEYDVSGKLALFYMISDQNLDVQELWMDQEGILWEDWLDYLYVD